MKHLKKIDELLKSTYLSAARGLSISHSKRAEELKRWAAEKGESEKIERIYPHRFNFKNDSIEVWKNVIYDDEYFFVTNIKQRTEGLREEYVEFQIGFRSNYGHNIVLSFSYNYLRTRDEEPGNWNRIKFESFGDDGVGRTYQFLSRKEAYEFKKCLLEWIEDEKLPNEYTKILKSISLNKFYISK